PLRTPVLCAGCPHRASFYIFKEAARATDAVFTGDIGCYTLGAMPPLKAVDTCLCMGASITIAAGLHRVEPARRQVAFLGDSTFFHSGVPGLINAVYNRARITVVILDNRTTAMTGHQPHPGLARTAMGPAGGPLDMARLAEACGVELVRQVDPYDLKAAGEAAREALNHPGPAVMIMKRECVALGKKGAPRAIDREKCVDCGSCIQDLGCPAIGRRDGAPAILENCFGCGVCAQVCPAGAIAEAGGEAGS
ncbi:MAG: 4Fe-4S binding protein, partial [Peptococcaceae bacterium]|nr:4Fe-4S binding protein [Peptococcaceae bacterium]